MILAKENYVDLRKYYRHTYVKFSKFAGDTVYKIVDVYEDKVHAVDSQDQHVALWLNGVDEIDYVIPGRAAFQCGNHASALVRVPARQFYRGIHQENTRFIVLGANGKWTKVGLDFKQIQDFVNKPVYHSIKSIVDTGPEDKSSWALSPQLCLTVGGVIVTVSGAQIGKLDFEGKKYRVNPLFEAEINKLGIPNYFTLIKAKIPKVKEKNPLIAEIENDF